MQEVREYSTDSTCFIDKIELTNLSAVSSSLLAISLCWHCTGDVCFGFQSAGTKQLQISFKPTAVVLPVDFSTQVPLVVTTFRVVPFLNKVDAPFSDRLGVCRKKICFQLSNWAVLFKSALSFLTNLLSMDYSWIAKICYLRLLLTIPIFGLPLFEVYKIQNMLKTMSLTSTKTSYAQMLSINQKLPTFFKCTTPSLVTHI